MAYSFQVTFDAQRPHALAGWWAETLGWQVEQQDEDFIRRMVEQGQASEGDTARHGGRLVWAAGAAIVSPDGQRMLFQQVPEAKVVKNRVHLDVRVGEGVDELVTRLQERGATFLHNGAQGPYRWVTMQDPEGNEFCVT